MLTRPLTLAIVDDHVLFRTALVNFLLIQKELRVEIDTDDAIQLLDRLEKTHIDIVLLDLFMPKMNGMDIFTILRRQYPDIKTIIISMCTDINVICGLLELGLHAYIEKSAEPIELLNAIDAVRDNRIYRSKLLTEALYQEKEKSINSSRKRQKTMLTEREKNIIQLLWEEKTTKEISSMMYLSVSSVEKIKQELKEKLDVKSDAGLFKHALIDGIISIKKIKLAKV